MGEATATAGEYFLGEGGVMTTVHGLVVDEGALSPIRRAKVFLRLVKGVRTWSESRGAERVVVHATTGRKLGAINRLLRVAGLKLMGGGYLG